MDNAGMLNEAEADIVAGDNAIGDAESNLYALTWYASAIAKTLLVMARQQTESRDSVEGFTLP